MYRARFSLALMLLLSAWSAAEEPQKPADGRALFAQRVWPLLVEKCHACHGAKPADIKGKYSLLTREKALRAGESGEAAIVPGRPEKSPLLAAVRWEDGLEMPPKENDRLSEEQVGWIRDWIAAGAPWPDVVGVPASAGLKDSKDRLKPGLQQMASVPTSGGLSPEWTNRKYDPRNLWAYQPLRKPGVPADATSSPIDAFILQRLGELKITPAPLADRRTLIRRVTFDLVGLPPTPAEIEAFLADPAPDDQAFARVVDRLLASPHYGEHWARHWLDVVRYADSSGFANDYARGNAWRYRDYVVRAFNDDKPYDQFVREQLAGDELVGVPPSGGDQGPAKAGTPSELLIAVGFLRMGPWELTGMEVPKIARQRFLDDVTDITGQVFLGHMLQCARCHDHKFDPVPTRDYYRVQAAFATTQIGEREAPFLECENLAGFEERKYLDQRRREYETTLARLQQKETAAAKAWAAERGLEYIPRNQGLKRGVAEEKLPPRHVGLTAEEMGHERIARKGLERLKWELDRYEPVALSVYSGRTPERTAVLTPPRMPADRLTAGMFEAVSVLSGGDPFSPREQVQPGTLSVVSLRSDVNPEIPEAIEGRRAALAEWIVDPTNPLTARVMVNRIWQWHFDRPLAGNPNNFGATGKKPTHPELLDWLATTFIEEGWSIKSLHRHILLSETYRRASSPGGIDPDGTSYAFFPSRRLTAEELRDAMLFVSGELNPAIGGIPVRPEINRDVALQPRQVMGTFAEAWQPSPRPEQRHRRSLYALRLRGQRDPLLEVFNEPSPDVSCEARETSTVTPQVFSLLNSEASYARALTFATRALRETISREAAIQRAFALAFGRPAKEDEVQSCLQHWESMTARHRTLKFEKPQPPGELVREAVEENTGEKFTFVEKLHAAADFVPDLHPSDVGPEVRGLAEVCLVLLNANEFVYVY